jgi:hypothetical protein
MKFLSRTIPLIVLALLVTALFPAMTAAKESRKNTAQVAATNSAQGFTIGVAQGVVEPIVVRSSEQFQPAHGRAYLRSNAAVFDGTMDAVGRVEPNRRARDATAGRNHLARSGTNKTITDSGASFSPLPTARSSPINRSEAASGPSFNALDQTLGWRS